MDMTDLLNDCYKRGVTVRIFVAGDSGSLGILGVVSDVTTDLVEVIRPEGETVYIRNRSIDVVVLAP